MGLEQPGSWLLLLLVLACPIGMAAMMWFMRARGRPSQDGEER